MKESKIALFLKRKRKDSNLTAKEVADILKTNYNLNISDKTINGYENNRSTPNADTFIALCEIYNAHFPITELKRLEDHGEKSLSENETDLIDQFRKLSEFDKKTILILINRMVQSHSFKKTIQRPVFLMPASAGSGQFLDSDQYELVDFPEEVVPPESNFAVRVSGNSMFPEFNDGSVVFVKQTKCIGIGEIGIFVVNGEGYLKKLGNHELISINPDYENIPINRFDEIRVVGKVVGKYDA